ncbi:50S ribosomal subunit protein L18 [Candidatus Hodgkinia cicadicola]|uniref:50S ribosomal subunit protein L18 n=1 Tax=Candidatus Hodgkinia cicadicola TaxID=573658 RepID=A0ABX4MG20_9HYPH|nr:50S ribosomal subunit protein L18 [Candidatus Hodgkinia cicadicola]
MVRDRTPKLSILRFNHATCIELIDNGVYKMLRGTKGGSDLVMRMAQYCLAVGVFHFRFVNRYKGGIIQDVEAFRSLGFIV